ncbi:extracellular solute-binding protein [Poriferisphaera sp. WC338]|uniref:extracellular solute-binding protein n=1 Tax=Poriferisphaera sp. WC338 TaxID=3425129 RepID=UPI003D812EA1
MRLMRLMAVWCGLMLLCWGVVGCGDAREEVVVYCAHDSVFAQDVLTAFEKETGIRVRVKYDTESTKSLGLTELILFEREEPVCDVFWNNQLLGTAELAEQGVLEPYQGEGWQRMPVGLKDANGLYAGFGARLRVLIVNTEKMKAEEEAVRGRLGLKYSSLMGWSHALNDTAGWQDDMSRVAMAKPMYGTTLSHYAVMWDLLDEFSSAGWHRDWRGRGLVEVGGNGVVKNLVATGMCDLGFTDTDDFYVAKDAGKPVAMLPVRVGEKQQTICIPNTVALIKGAEHAEAGKQLIDFLLSEKVELMLAASKSRQIPLGAVDETKLSEEVKELRAWAVDAYPLAGLREKRAAALAWLKNNYTGD